MTARDAVQRVAVGLLAGVTTAILVAVVGLAPTSAAVVEASIIPSRSLLVGSSATTDDVELLIDELLAVAQHTSFRAIVEQRHDVLTAGIGLQWERSGPGQTTLALEARGAEPERTSSVARAAIQTAFALVHEQRREQAVLEHGLARAAEQVAIAEVRDIEVAIGSTIDEQLTEAVAVEARLEAQLADNPSGDARSRLDARLSETRDEIASLRESIATREGLRTAATRARTTVATTSAQRARLEAIDEPIASSAIVLTAPYRRSTARSLRVAGLSGSAVFVLVTAVLLITLRRFWREPLSVTGPPQRAVPDPPADERLDTGDNAQDHTDGAPVPNVAPGGTIASRDERRQPALLYVEDRQEARHLSHEPAPGPTAGTVDPPEAEQPPIEDTSLDWRLRADLTGDYPTNPDDDLHFDLTGDYPTNPDDDLHFDLTGDYPTNLRTESTDGTDEDDPSWTTTRPNPNPNPNPTTKPSSTTTNPNPTTKPSSTTTNPNPNPTTKPSSTTTNPNPNPTTKPSPTTTNPNPNPTTKPSPTTTNPNPNPTTKPSPTTTNPNPNPTTKPSSTTASPTRTRRRPRPDRQPARAPKRHPTRRQHRRRARRGFGARSTRIRGTQLASRRADGCRRRRPPENGLVRASCCTHHAHIR